MLGILSMTVFFLRFAEKDWVTETLSHLARVPQLGSDRVGDQPSIQVWLLASHSSPHAVLFVASLSLLLCLSVSQNGRRRRETGLARGWSTGGKTKTEFCEIEA